MSLYARIILKFEMCNLIRVGWYLGKKEDNTAILTLTNPPESSYTRLRMSEVKETLVIF